MIEDGEGNRVIVTYQDRGLDVRLVIAPATARSSLVRNFLSESAKRAYNLWPKYENEDNVLNIVDTIMVNILYPSLVASVVEQSGFEHWPMTLKEFADIPDGLEIEWEKAAHHVNPHWFPKTATDEEIEEYRKKVIATTSESSKGKKRSLKSPSQIT